MIERNKCKYAKERDEYIKILEKPIRITKGEVMSWFNIPSDEDIYKQYLLINKSKNRRPQAIKIKRSKKMTK